MTVPEIIGCSVLGLTLGAQVFLRSFLVLHRRTVLLFSVSVVFAGVAWMVFQQYAAWHTDPFSRLLLPPYQSWGYFLSYVWSRFIDDWVFAGMVGLGAAWLTRWLNRRYDERFFENEEPFFFGFAIFLTSYPAFLFYIMFMFGGGVLLSLVYMLRGNGRAPLYFLWLPVALFAILIVHTFVDPLRLGTLNF